nr:L-lactate dehydrogenase [Alphaproteobacteria bacterium]
DSEVLHWSGATVANMPLVDMAAQVAAPITQNLRTQIDERVRRAAYRIIQGKGATWYGIGAGMARIAQAILQDEHAVLTCCVRLPEVEGISDVTLSLPHIVAGQGVRQTLYPLLDKTERQQLRRSAEILKQAIHSLGL